MEGTKSPYHLIIQNIYILKGTEGKLCGEESSGIILKDAWEKICGKEEHELKMQTYAYFDTISKNQKGRDFHGCPVVSNHLSMQWTQV